MRIFPRLPSFVERNLFPWLVSFAQNRVNSVYESAAGRVYSEYSLNADGKGYR